LKKYLHLADESGFKTPLQWDKIKNKQFRGNRLFLTTDEINRLYAYYASTFINETHKNVPARFLFSCFTGLRISDIQKLTPNNFIENWLVFTIEKTGILSRIPLNETAKIFVQEEQVFQGKYSPEYINRELKEIAKVASIKKHLSFHISRHTFATNFLLSGGNVVKLQTLLGHSKIETTMVYCSHRGRADERSNF